MMAKDVKVKTSKKLLTKPVKSIKSKTPKQNKPIKSGMGRKGALGATSGY